MKRDLVIIGCGGFGREVADVVSAINVASSSGPEWNVIGFLDDAPSKRDQERVERIGLRVLGTIDSLAATMAGVYYVVAVADPQARQRVVARCERAGLLPATLLHPSARIGNDVVIGHDTIVCGGVTITTNIRIGDHVQINPNTTIGHDTTIGDYVTMSPLVAISGNCSIKELTMLGIHSTVLPGLSVGPNAMVGGGACVVREVSPGSTVKGVPAK